MDPKKYAGFRVNSSPALGKRVAKMLKDGGVNAIEDPKELTLFSIFHIGLTLQMILLMILLGCVTACVIERKIALRDLI